MEGINFKSVKNKQRLLRYNIAGIGGNIECFYLSDKRVMLHALVPHNNEINRND